MKKLKSLCGAVVLTLLLALPVFAGQMTTTVADPPPPTADGQMTTTIAGQMQTGSSEAVDPVTQVALSLLQSVLSLF
jgi:Spy/CpxP family protein refolding chaperone